MSKSAIQQQNTHSIDTGSNKSNDNDGRKGRQRRYEYIQLKVFQESNSFYLNIPIPEEIVSSKVRAKMSNGVDIELPKKDPTKLEEEEGTTVEIK